MIQSEFKESVFEFVKRASDLEKVESITLFGSVATGKAKVDSDIDFLVVVSDQRVGKDLTEIANGLEDKYNKKFQVLIKTKKLEELDPSTIEDISINGILLYGLPLKIKHERLELEPYLVAIYSLAHLPQSEKMKFKRSIFGSESVSGKTKKYRTVQEGLLKTCGGARLGRGAIIFPSKHKEIIEQLEYFKVKFKVFTVYANLHILEWINAFNESIFGIVLIDDTY